MGLAEAVLAPGACSSNHTCSFYRHLVSPAVHATSKPGGFKQLGDGVLVGGGERAGNSASEYMYQRGPSGAVQPRAET